MRVTGLPHLPLPLERFGSENGKGIATTTGERPGEKALVWAAFQYLPETVQSGVGRGTTNAKGQELEIQTIYRKPALPAYLITSYRK